MRSKYLTTFTKAFLTSLFVGIIATVLCLIYNVIFREETAFPFNDIINVSTLIFFVNLLFLVIGVIYYLFIKYIKSELIYIVVFLLLTLYLIIKVNQIQRSNVQLFNEEFHHLFIAMIAIMGVAAFVGIPVLFHSKRFEDEVL